MLRKNEPSTYPPPKKMEISLVFKESGRLEARFLVKNAVVVAGSRG